MRKAWLIAAAVAVLLLTALLVVPAVIDWNRYKDDIVARLEAATGREVTIAGDIGLTLLPAPAFTAGRIAVGNIEGAGDEPFATAERLAVRVALVPLLTGRVAVESLVLDRPEVNLVRMPDGRGNWQLTPAAEAGPPAAGEPTGPAPAEGGEAISVDRVQVRDGRVGYRSGAGKPLRVEDIDARFEAGGARGPFKARGSLAIEGTELEFEGGIDRVDDPKGSPARLAVLLPDARARVEFSGLVSPSAAGPAAIRGRLALSVPDLPRVSAVAGGPATLPLPAGTGLQAEAAVAVDGDQAVLSDLVATLGETRATGAVTIGLAEVTRVDARLAVASLDLDKLLAARPAPEKRAAKGPPPSPSPGPAQPPQTETAAAPFALPKDLFATVELAVDALSWRGAVVREARAQATLDNGELVVNGATAQLPGGSVVSVAGALAAADGRPVFDGQAEARSDNLRALLDWLGVDAAAVPRDRLRRFEASTNLRAAWPEIEARHLTVLLDATRANGQLSARLTEHPAYGVRLTVDNVNLDAYLPEEPPASAPGAPAPATTPPAAPPAASAPATGGPLEALAGFDADVRVTVGRLTMNGVPADGVRLAAALADGDLTVTEAAAELAGSRAAASGRVLGLPQARPRVENVAVRIDSPQPARLFRFLGIPSPIELERLGGLSASGRLDGDWQAIALTAQAEAGGLRLAADGTLASPLADPTYRLAVQAGHQSFAQLVRLFSPAYRPTGTVGAFSLAANVDGAPQGITVSGIDLKAGSARLTGDGKVALDGARPKITAGLAANAVTLDPFLPADRTGFLLPGWPRLPPSVAPPAPAILPAATGGAGPWSRQPLDLSALQAVDARVKVQAEALAWQGWVLASPQAMLVVDQGIAAIDSLTGKLLGGDMNLSARLASAGLPALEGALTIAGANISEARLGAGGIQVTDGRMNAEARFATAGRSSQEMAERLGGDGSLTVRDGVIQGFDLPAVNRQLQNIENVGSLLGLLNAGLSRGTTRFSQLAGTFTAENGVVTTRDLRLDAEGGHATAEAVVRLPPWSMNAAIAFTLADTQAPPAIVRLEGPIDNPRKIIDVNAIQQHLLARGLGRALKGREAGRVLEGLLGGGRPPPPAQDQQGEAPPAEQKPDRAKILQDLLRGLGR